MDRRKNYYLMLDTETCPIEKSEEVNAKNMLVYDLGFAIIDKKGEIYEKGSYVINEIFYGEQDKMKSSYYANKLPQYFEEIEKGERTPIDWNELAKILKKLCKQYNVTAIVAHNAYFDYTTIRNTQQYLQKNYLLPYCQWFDTLKMARDILKTRKTYNSFCEENNYKTKRNQNRLTAEIIFRYLNLDTDFIEKHTGFEDVLIEKEIFAYCMKQHQTFKKLLFA